MEFVNTIISNVTVNNVVAMAFVNMVVISLVVLLVHHINVKDVDFIPSKIKINKVKDFARIAIQVLKGEMSMTSTDLK